ncbi:DMT family transporter [Paenibacillus luteus]|uniref:DMT family transporter n=1 Tax=Paenibacillus luteus TaxID=2545753 RepID=UPI001143A629|nr:DMT family transporter [Paenibacillus luteus]
MKNGVVFALLSASVFSVMNVLVKAVSNHIPAAEIAFFRGLIGTILILFFMHYSRMSFSRNGIPMLVIRGLMGGLYMLAFFYTLSKMPLSDASILAQTSPVFVILLSGLILKERISGSAGWLLALTFIGAICLVNPIQYSSFSLIALVGLLGALCSAAASISIRYLSKSHPSYEIVFYFVATSMLIAIPFMWHSFVIPSWVDITYLFAIGVVSLLGQIFLTKAFTHENAVVVQMISYSGLLMNVLFGLWFWREIPDVITFIGGFLIIVGCTGLSVMKQRQVKEVSV